MTRQSTIDRRRALARVTTYSVHVLGETRRFEIDHNAGQLTAARVASDLTGYAPEHIAKHLQRLESSGEYIEIGPEARGIARNQSLTVDGLGVGHPRVRVMRHDAGR